MNCRANYKFNGLTADIAYQQLMSFSYTTFTLYISKFEKDIVLECMIRNGPNNQKFKIIQL